MCKTYFDHIMAMRELAREDDHTMEFLENMYDLDDSWVAETESENGEIRLSQKANHSARRKAKYAASIRRYETRELKKQKRYGHKAIRSAMERKPKYGQLYQFDHDGSTYLTWNQTDPNVKWRNRNRKEIDIYEA